jgi:formyl-CoA transferase
VPIKFAAEPARPDFALARLGEHGDEILASLGYDAARIAALRAEGALG